MKDEAKLARTTATAILVMTNWNAVARALQMRTRTEHRAPGRLGCHVGASAPAHHVTCGSTGGPVVRSFASLIVAGGLRWQRRSGAGLMT